MSVTVRPLEPSDRVKLWQFVTVCGERTRQLFQPVTWFYTVEGVSWWMDMLETDSKYVAENLTQEIVGLAYYVPKGDIASLGICVCDSWQRKGVGGKLLDALERHAHDRGFKKIQTDGGTRRNGMLKGLLKKRGYRFTGLYRGNEEQVMFDKEV